MGKDKPIALRISRQELTRDREEALRRAFGDVEIITFPLQFTGEPDEVARAFDLAVMGFDPIVVEVACGWPLISHIMRHSEWVSRGGELIRERYRPTREGRVFLFYERIDWCDIRATILK